INTLSSTESLTVS
nr:S3 SGP=S-locus specific glycoprotein [Brassica oleracea L., var. acephala, Peptide Partial, 13 aa] [Brassica oleracea]